MAAVESFESKLKGSVIFGWLGAVLYDHLSLAVFTVPGNSTNI